MKPYLRLPRHITRALRGVGLSLVLALSCLGHAAAEDTAVKAEEGKTAEKPLAELSKGREELKLPGLTVRIKERYVDVEARICLDSGMLELIACTKDSKEHESFIAVEPKAAHIHAALLLIGARPGNPAIRKLLDGPQPRLVDIPPRGQNIDVFLEFENEEGVPTEYPIKRFIRRAEEHDVYKNEEDDAEPVEFPTNTFLFAGSRVYKDGKSAPVYLSDESGNVISLATFGDELLCLPGVHGHGNEGLVWEVNTEALPALDTKVILRLRPQFASDDSPEKHKTNDALDD